MDLPVGHSFSYPELYLHGLFRSICVRFAFHQALRIHRKVDTICLQPLSFARDIAPLWLQTPRAETIRNASSFSHFTTLRLLYFDTIAVMIDVWYSIYNLVQIWYSYAENKWEVIFSCSHCPPLSSEPSNECFWRKSLHETASHENASHKFTNELYVSVFVGWIVSPNQDDDDDDDDMS